MADKGLEEIPEGMFNHLARLEFLMEDLWPGKAIAQTERRLTFCAGQIESNYDEVTDSFDNMNLKAELLRGMAESHRWEEER